MKVQALSTTQKMQASIRVPLINYYDTCEKVLNQFRYVNALACYVSAIGAVATCKHSQVKKCAALLLIVF